MPRKNRDRINDDRLRQYLLHKECVRRNAKYVADYQELKQIKDKTHFNFRESILISSWGFLNNDELPNPEEAPDLDKLKNSKAPSSIYLPGDFNYDMLVSRAHSMLGFGIFDLLDDKKRNALKGILVLLYIPEEPQKPYITAINTKLAKKDIEESLLYWADKIISDRKKHGLKQKYPNKRLRIEQGFEYLKVYDLREKGKSFGKIAKQLWPQGEGELERQASLYYQKAKKLIDQPPILQRLREQFEERRRR